MYGAITLLQQPSMQHDGVETSPLVPKRQLPRSLALLWLTVGCVSLSSIVLGISSVVKGVTPNVSHGEAVPQQFASRSVDDNALGCFPVPSIQVFECPVVTTIDIAQSLADRSIPFPATQADLCYTNTTFHIAFSTHEEMSFLTNPSYGHNDNIWEYNVFEAFIALGTDDPVEYFEFEVSPTNQTYSAYILNPRKDFSPPVGHFYVGGDEAEARALGIQVVTETDRATHTWVSVAELPLGLFDVTAPQGTLWRMNFMRKITNTTIFPNQHCGAWNAPNQYNFHETPCFGRVHFVASPSPKNASIT
ncbi:hypothetical protein H310_10490 [Aphanomyces invadans]|uniref:Carbohydrate-binding domain-containing protein n=1 Tax=Aphanomyces invadans TaxID=157072 RepID=A0A024TQM1_9STRA|nr:hypothetical protein H310_10490 [Aphanomyces invadans]ETV96328.1 hypothetical protein H310_10490 [Aphanomyces invadans]RHY30268.1 hypothetical protein DYB32_004521 [Aphanomyces invadans]|eukprot:XP_008875120.1 hypothetical protein H310_10490 [Aphanomyces invadans]